MVYLARSKRHHFVPQALQRQFLTDDGRIWYASRPSYDVPFSDPEALSTKGAFWRRNFYTVLDDRDAPSDLVEEKFFGPVDNHLSQVVNEALEILREGERPRFRGDPLESIKHLVIALYRRSIDTASTMDEALVGRELIDSVLERARSELGEDFEKAVESLSFPLPMHMGRDVRVRAQVSDPTLLIEALAGYRIAVVRAEGGSSFILGSRMVYRISNRTNDKLGSENIEIWFPISPRYALVLHALRTDPDDIIEWKKSGVRSVNEYICRHCLAVGSHSQKLLSSLLRRKS